jgi:hypothetical protein
MKKILLIFSCLHGIFTFSQAPNFEWAQQFGGPSGFDYGKSLTTDLSGNVYTVGTFQDTATFGSTTLTSSGANDVFVLKTTPSGTVIWAQKFGGASNDYGEDIVTDSQGNVYITGTFYSSITLGSITLTSVGLKDIFVAKIDNAGNIVWAQRYGNSGINEINDITIDTSNNLFITGGFPSSITFGSTTLTSAGSKDIFVTKINSSGTVIWAKRFGGTGLDEGYGIADDAAGNIYVIGNFRQTISFGSTAFTAYNQATNNSDVFIVKIDQLGNALWAKQFGGTNNDNGEDIVVDLSGYIYVTGYFVGTSTFGSTTFTSSPGGEDVFVVKINTAGSVIWARQYGGNGIATSKSIATDSGGNIYVSGAFSGTASFGSSTVTSQGIDAQGYFLKIDSSGTVNWIERLGGLLHSHAYDIATDVSDNVYVTGYFAGTLTFGTLTLTSQTSYNALLLKLNENCIPATGIDTKTACSSFTWTAGNGQTYNSSTTAIHTISNGAANGCDSIVTLNLTINQPTTHIITATSCVNYVLNAQTYTSSGTYTQTLTNTNNCDSIITLNLTIKQPTAHTITTTACGSYTLNSQTYNSSGVYTQTLTNSNNCDSTITLHLTIKQPTSSLLNQTACGSYTLNGQTYTSSGTYTQMLTNAAGCDSTVTLNLTIRQPSSATDVKSACGSYTWINGITYTSNNNTATHILTNAAGCDSTVTLNLTIRQPSSATDVKSACGSYTWINGITYTSNNNTATHILTNAVGCDSVITLNLTINHVNNTVFTSGITLTANQAGATYQWLNCNNGNSIISGATSQTFTAPSNGNYAVAITANGCTDTSNCTNIFTVGIEENVLSDWQIFPNPSQGTVYIVGLPAHASIKIYDGLGRMVYSLNQTEEMQTIDLSSFKSGLYYMQPEIDGKISTMKKVVLNP